MRTVSAAAFASILAATSFSAIAHAQTAPANAVAPDDASTESEQVGLAEIIVTAEKRNTSLQKTPISITAIGGADLKASQVRSLTDITSLVPGFQMGVANGYSQITIRGIGIANYVPSAESAVAVNNNEVYISRPIAQQAGFYDVSSIEVLRGPQGTLYGRNATAGSVNITTARPTDVWSGFGNISYGNYNNVRGEGAVGGPIIDDRLLVRVAGFFERRDGFGKNLVTGNDIDDKNTYGVRGTVVLKATPELTATLIAEYFHERDNGAALHYFGAAGLTGLPGALGVAPLFERLGGYTTTDPYDIANGVDPQFMLRTTAVTGILEWTRGPFSVKSITGYRDQNSFTSTSLDGGSIYNFGFIAGEPAHQFSQELQAHYDTSTAHLTVGGYYFKEHDDYSPATVPASNVLLNLGFPALPQRPVVGYTHFAEIGGLTRTTAKAAFAQGTVNVTESLSVTAGIRYSSERKRLLQRYAIDLYTPYVGINNAPVGVEIPGKTFNSTTPKFGIQYQITPQTLIYATYAKGFKSGGFDPGANPAVVAIGFQPEKLTSYEGGIKTSFLDNRVRLNVSGYYYNYTNLQVLQTVGLAVATSNAGVARAYGMEVELSAAVTPEFTFDANGAWSHARYREYVGPDSARPLLPSVDFSGNRLNNAPDFRAHLAGTYQWETTSGSIALRVEGDYSSEFYFSPANIGLLGQKSFAKANAFLTYTNNRGWHVTAYVRNLTDKATRTSGGINHPLTGNPAQGGYAPPRTFGLELGYKF